MNQAELLNKLDHLIDDAKVAVLTTLGLDGYPSARWMSPAVVRGSPGYLYAITSPDFAKTQDLAKNSKVMWMIQTKALDEVMSLKGHMSVISNPNLQAMVQEAIGGKVATFWKLNPDMSKVVVLETRIDSIEYFVPSKALKERLELDHKARGEADA